MWIAHDYRTAKCVGDTAIAIGNFDGVHRGHRALLELARREAAALGLSPVALTFEPHPTRVLAPDRSPPRITGADYRLELFAQLGIDGVVVQGFDRGFASMTPEHFAREVLLGLRAKVVVVGENFHFGKDRAGDGEVLKSLGKILGFRVEVLPIIRDGEEILSSSMVRQALASGEIDRASRILGRLADFDGRVVQGDGRGRSIGFATANLRTDVEALPADGVYAVRVRVLSRGAQTYDAVMNLGVRPTFAAGRSIEVHLFDFDQSLYGQLLRVQCVERLRDERRFANVGELVEQIARDITAARESLARHPRSPDAENRP
ncbi:MAG: bifunctional riboflavin kinase/FAD synthetase [Deltaproteobacteria bacterium]|nr:bifunctional riboflavin kinase/FAD synthetase [Deltaproteobacteria bacterium]